MLNYECLGSDVAITVTCIVCGNTHYLTVPYKDFYNWQTGSLIQDCFPHVPPDVRELLISKICGSCFDDIFNLESDCGDE